MFKVILGLHVSIIVNQLTAHIETLIKGFPARYNFTRVELKTFTFASGSRSLSIDNAVLGILPKRLIFTMVKNTDFWAVWIRTRTISDITISKTLRCMSTADRSLEKAWIYLWTMKKLPSWDTELYLRALAFIIRTRDFR